MEKKDLVIGKKYLHKSKIEVYYLGEGNNKCSVVQPTNGVDGVTSLKDFHPKIKDIIGNDRFWAYGNIHLELTEIESKSLSLQDLIIGEIYVSEVPNHPEWRSLFKCISDTDEDYSYKYRLYTSNDYHGNKLDLREYGFTDTNSHYKASKEESKWLNVCIKANKFIPKEDLDLYDDVTFELKSLKESTESNENKFEIGTWYYCESTYKWYFKYVKEDSSKVEFYDHIDIDLKKFKRNDFLCHLTKKEIKDVRKVDLSEIQEYLPEGHIDKTIEEFTLPEKWCIKQSAGEEVCEWFNKKYDTTSFPTGSYEYLVNDEYNIYSDYIPQGYTEITFKQFKKYVLKESIEEPKEIIPEYVEYIKSDDVGKIVKVLKWSTASYCKVEFPNGTIKEPFKHLVKSSTKEAFDAQNKPKSIGKWSVGSYVVALVDYVLSKTVKKGDIMEITSIKHNSIYFNNFGLHDYQKPTILPQLEWFATKSEAQEFSKTLLNKDDMFKKDDYIVITIPNQNNDGFITDFCYKQRDNDLYLRPELTTLGNIRNGWRLITYSSSHWRYATKEEIAEYDRLGKPFDVTTLNKKEELEVDSLSEWEDKVKKLNLDVYELANYINDLKTPDSIYGKLSGFLSEEKAHLLISKWGKEDYNGNNKENYTQKVGDWVVTDMMNANSHHKDKAYKVIEIDNYYPLQPCFKITESDDSKDYSWCYPHGDKKSVKKALSHEIPKIAKEELLKEAKRRYPIGCTYKSITSPSTYQLKSELEIDKYGNICDADRTCHVYLNNKWAETIYKDLPYMNISFQPYFEVMVPSDECNSKLDLSLRDEKEINIKEIKSNNNNNSKLNLSLNN